MTSHGRYNEIVKHRHQIRVVLEITGNMLEHALHNMQTLQVHDDFPNRLGTCIIVAQLRGLTALCWRDIALWRRTVETYLWHNMVCLLDTHDLEGAIDVFGFPEVGEWYVYIHSAFV